MSKRLPTWPRALTLALEQHRRTPFAWGSHDCCQFSRHAIAMMRGGEDPAEQFGLQPYDTAAGAAAELARLGLASLEDVPAACGFAEIPVALAGRGDLVARDFTLEGKPSPTLGIVEGRTAAFPGPAGLVFCPVLECRRAWRVE
jgi:hypothetical protein